MAELRTVIQRVMAGSRDEVDLVAIATAIQAGQAVLSTGTRAISISGDANDSVNVTGDHNQVLIIKGAEAETIARLLPQPLTAQAISVDEEVVQQV